MKKQRNNLKVTVFLALLTALSIVLGKYLAIRVGDIMRFSLENMPIIFAAMAFGPIAGALVGLVADLVGCLLVGYAINPIVTLGGVTVGVVAGLLPMLLHKTKIRFWLITVISVASAHFLGSAVIKTLGLAAFYGYPLHILFAWRCLNYLIVGALDGVVVYILLKNPSIKKEILEIKGDKK